MDVEKQWISITSKISIFAKTWRFLCSRISLNRKLYRYENKKTICSVKKSFENFSINSEINGRSLIFAVLTTRTKIVLLSLESAVYGRFGL